MTDSDSYESEEFEPEDADSSERPIESVPEFARFPSGSGFLILGGPDTGSVVTEVPEVNQSTPMREAGTPRDRDDALSGEVPIFFAQRSAQRYKSIPHVLVQLHVNHSEVLSTGVISKLTGATRTSHRAFFDLTPLASVKIVDPMCFLLDGGVLRLPPDPIKDRAVKNAPYLAEDPASNNWVESVIAGQRGAGANLLLSPGRALDPDTPEESLDVACTQGDETASHLLTGERCALNLTIPARWLVSDALRDRLLTQIVEQDQFDVIYVRIQWASPGAASAQVVDAALIDGIKELANLCQDEERKLILPQTGMTGWLSLAFGATGFGTGTSSGEQGFAEFAFRRRAPGATEVERYFERQILHTVDRAVHESIATGPEYVACTCTYCAQLVPGRVWNHELAAYHQLHAIGELTARVQSDSARGGRHGAVRRIVRDARQYANGQPLVDTNFPRHLETWGQAL
ncbi:hypothetical protein [Streptomyces sp. NPDC008139]|uniref:hypothetical protein n=1 Tax=Streptomyces sp. NPDC008139 TaxID=3364814 RepID=UPI0036EC709F